MQVNVISGGMPADQAFRSMVYKPPEQSLLNYLQDNIQQGAQALGDIGRDFVAGAQSMYEKVNNSAVINASKALLMNIDSHISQDAIYYVNQNNIEDANTIMQQYIMANPVMNNLYQRDMSYGFQDTYFDKEPDVKGEEREDYRRVMDGSLEFFDDGVGYVVSYASSDETELDMMEKITIKDTWAEVERMIALGIDPSDPDLGTL